MYTLQTNKTPTNMDTIRKELSLAESQLSAFQSRKTKSSATRARAHLLNIRKACDKLRKQILEESKARKKPAEIEPAGEPVEEPVEEAQPVEEEPVEEPKAKRKAKTKRKTKKWITL